MKPYAMAKRKLEQATSPVYRESSPFLRGNFSFLSCFVRLTGWSVNTAQPDSIPLRPSQDAIPLSRTATR